MSTYLSCRLFWVYCFILPCWRLRSGIDLVNVKRVVAVSTPYDDSHLFTVVAIWWSPAPPLDNIWVMGIVWRLGGNIIRTALCWIVWHSVHSQQHTYVGSSYRSNRLGLSHRDLYAVHRGGCLEFYYCNVVEWFWWDSSLISTTNWFPSVLWHCWFSHLDGKIVPEMTYNVSSGTLNPTHSLTHSPKCSCAQASLPGNVPGWWWW